MVYCQCLGVGCKSHKIMLHLISLHLTSVCFCVPLFRLKMTCSLNPICPCCYLRVITSDLCVQTCMSVPLFSTHLSRIQRSHDHWEPWAGPWSIFCPAGIPAVHKGFPTFFPNVLSTVLSELIPTPHVWCHLNVGHLKGRNWSFQPFLLWAFLLFFSWLVDLIWLVKAIYNCLGFVMIFFWSWWLCAT